MQDNPTFGDAMHEVHPEIDRQLKLPPCFVCGKELKPAVRFEEGPWSAPWAAVIFDAEGNFGSRVWDNLSSNTHLQINVCDDCLVERKDHILTVTDATPVRTRKAEWGLTSQE